MASALVTIEEAKRQLGLDEADSAPDVRLDQLLRYASARVEDYCGRPFRLVSQDERHEGGREVIILDVRPISSVTEVSDFLDPADPVVVSAPTYDLDPAEGTLRKVDGSDWGPGRRRWRVEYEAGFASAPEAIREAVIALAGARLSEGTGAFKSERIGDYSYEKATTESGAGLPPEA